MPSFDRSDLPDLVALAAIVRRRSFKAAAIELGVSSSALSHAMRRLEQRLGVRLLNRTTRSVAPTAAGALFAERLLDGFDRIAEAVADIGARTGRSMGELRLNVPQDAARLLVAPALAAFAAARPDTRLTVVVENRPVDIVAEGYDAGVRYGHIVPEDMVAVALTAPLEWVVVGAPAYLDARGRPQTPDDLRDHVCLQVLLGDNSLFRWELGDGARMVVLDVPGPCTLNDPQATIDAALDGLGLAYLLRRRVERELADGRLELVLPDWSSTGAGLHAYYASRRQPHPGLHALIGLIRNREGLPPLA